MINKEFGGVVVKQAAREDGQFTVPVDINSAIFRYSWIEIQPSCFVLLLLYKLRASIWFKNNFCRGMCPSQDVLLTHGDSVEKVAEDFRVIARSGDIIAGELFQWHYWTNE